jgi:DNA-directed RNA polymerase specialized sigma24 family protein
VQETYARWYAMPEQQRAAIESPGGWLTTVASRICLDVLGSARARWERYMGQWIPEPLPEPAEWASTRPGAGIVRDFKHAWETHDIASTSPATPSASLATHLRWPSSNAPSTASQASSPSKTASP